MRIHFSYQLAPVPTTGPDACMRFCLELGMNPWLGIGDGAIRRDVAVAMGPNNSWLPAASLDWAAEDKSSPEEPFNSAAVTAAGRLALHPFYTPEIPPTRSFFFDFEGAWWNPSAAEGADAAKQKPAVFDFQGESYNQRICCAMAGYLWQASQAAGNQLRTHAGAFGWPASYMLRGPALPDYFASTFNGQSYDLLANLTCAMPELYTWPDRMADETWFDYLQLITKDLDRLLPWLPRFAFLCPLYQKRGDSMLAYRAKLDGSPVPADFWRGQIRAVIDAGYEPFIWTPFEAALTPELARLLTIAAQMGDGR